MRTDDADGSDTEFWHRLIDEREAGAFLGLSQRHMQGLRYRGGGPCYIKLSSRCIRYRRIDLRQWAEARLRTNTSESDPEAA